MGIRLETTFRCKYWKNKCCIQEKFSGFCIFRSLQKSACEIPKLDPHHKLAMDEMMNVGKIDCIVKDFGVIKSRNLIVEGKSIRNAYFRYVQRSIGDDSEVEFSDPVLLMKATAELVKPGKLSYLYLRNLDCTHS